MPWFNLRLVEANEDVIYLYEHLIFAMFINGSVICKNITGFGM